MNPGDRLIIKLRLPHTEWEGEEVGICLRLPYRYWRQERRHRHIKSGLDADLSEDSSRGSRVRERFWNISECRRKPSKDSELNETVGYLAGLDGYEKARPDLGWRFF